MRFEAEKTLELATKLEKLIKERDLKPGDPFFSAAEAARHLGVSLNPANRALQLLSKRHLIVRRQRKGSFIVDPRLQMSGKHHLERVHFIVSYDFNAHERPLLEGILFGVQMRLNRAGVKFDMLPLKGVEEYAKELIEEASRSSASIGFVVIRAPLNVIQMIERSGLPAVVLGTPPPIIKGLSYVERDLRQVAKLAVDFFEGKGCERCLIYLRGALLQGDMDMLDHLMMQFGERGFKTSDVKIRCREISQELIGLDVVDFLCASERKAGILFHPTPFSGGVGKDAFLGLLQKSLRSAGIRHSPVILLSDPFYDPNCKLEVPHLLIDLTPEQRGELFADLLDEIAASPRGVRNIRLMPSALVEF